MTQNRKEKMAVRAVMEHLNVPYARALRLLEKGEYYVLDTGEVRKAS